MRIKEVLQQIRDFEPLTLLLMIEMNNFTSSEKLLIIEEYDTLVQYLLTIIHLKNAEV